MKLISSKPGKPPQVSCSASVSISEREGRGEREGMGRKREREKERDLLFFSYSQSHLSVSRPDHRPNVHLRNFRYCTSDSLQYTTLPLVYLYSPEPLMYVCSTRTRYTTPLAWENAFTEQDVLSSIGHTNVHCMFNWPHSLFSHHKTNQ